jgi:hypothetical protein
MNLELIKKLQLQAGGSHYPDINPQTQETFARLLLEECIRAVETSGTQCAYTTFDKGVVDCTIKMCSTSIKNRFQL